MDKQNQVEVPGWRCGIWSVQCTAVDTSPRSAWNGYYSLAPSYVTIHMGSTY